VILSECIPPLPFLFCSDPLHSGTLLEMQKDYISLVPYSVVGHFIARGAQNSSER
jgi:hypothetical protein